MEKLPAGIAAGDEAAREARLAQMPEQVPAALRHPAERILPNCLKGGPRAPGCFDVLVNSLTIMQERITRSRLAVEPSHVMITPEAASISLMDFDRAQEALAAGCKATEKALDAIGEMLAR